jgi:hypothetical protein
MRGELLRCKTSIGNATVDIRLPNIDIEEPSMRNRKRNAEEPDSETRMAEHFAIAPVAK